jgi:hypothetical protein
MAAGSAERYSAVDEVKRAIEKMRTGHQDHARTDRDEAQRRTQVVAACHRPDDAGEDGCAQRLQEHICS